MICRRCGNRIPENLVVRESFQCPNCGRQFGTPSVSREAGYDDRGVRSDRNYGYDREPRRAPSRYEESRSARYEEPRSARHSRFDYEEETSYDRRASARYQPEYASDDDYYDDEQYDDGYDDSYQDDQYDDGYDYDDQDYDGYDDGYQDDRYGYEDQYADYEPQRSVDGEAFVQPQFIDEQDDEELSDLINGGRPRPKGMRLVTLLYFLTAAVVVLIVVFCISANRKAEADKPGVIPPSAAPAVEADAGTVNSGDGQYPTV